MKVKPNLFSPANNLDSLLSALIGFVLIQIFSKHSGIGVSPDSVTYISAARHMLAGEGFKSFDNLPVVDFPFAYPFFLTIISFLTRLDPLQFGPVLNGTIFGLLLYTSGAIMNGFSNPSGWYKRILLVCILMSPAIQEVYSLLWSETIFLMLILLFIICISNFLKKISWSWLLISAVVSACACLTRYAGVFLVLAGISIIFFNRTNPLRRRILQCLVFGGLSVSLLLINIIHNLALTGLATGARQKNDLGIFKVFENFGGVLCDWLLLDRTPVPEIVLTTIVLLIFIVTIVLTFNRDKTKYGLEYVIAVTGVIYCIFMLVSSRFTRYEQFTSRLLSPMFIPLLWSASWWIPGFISRRSYGLKSLFGLTALFASALFLDIQLQADYEYYDGIKDAGVPGYREDPFTDSDIVRYVEKTKTRFDPRFQIYSNAGDAVYFISGLPAHQLPISAFPKQVQRYYAAKNNYLVWFRDLDNPDMPALDSILKNKNMLLLKQLPDGAVYISK
jgi:Dolichyl-phosphate-mannose-protein mannosyltransferase